MEIKLAGLMHPEKMTLEQVAANPQLSQQAKTAEAARQFEAMLLRQILANANKPVVKSEYAKQSLAGDIYRDLISAQIAEQVSTARQFGLARMLEKQFAPLHPKPDADGTQPAEQGSAVHEAKVNRQ